MESILDSASNNESAPATNVDDEAVITNPDDTKPMVTNTTSDKNVSTSKVTHPMFQESMNEFHRKLWDDVVASDVRNLESYGEQIKRLENEVKLLKKQKV